MYLHTHESEKIKWLCISENTQNGITNHYCADGDGIVEVLEIDGFFHLIDQSTHVYKVGRDLSKALQKAENYLHTNYRCIFNDCKIN